ncbi:hypothetical protein IKU74_00820 [bacterium]|nr:hypothetical protein [bacterium]
MSFLASHALKLHLIDREYKINEQIRQLDSKLSDLQRYGASIGDETISMQDMMGLPSSVFQRAMAFMNYSHNGALRGAQMNIQMMGPQLQAQMAQMQAQSQANPSAMAQYQQWIFQNLYKQELSKYQKHEAKLLNIQEQEIQKEKAKLNSELQIIKARYQTAEKMEKDGLQRFNA